MMIAFLKAPGHTLELIEYRAPAEREAVRARPCDTGFAHVAFNVDDDRPGTEQGKKGGLRARLGWRNDRIHRGGH